MLGVTTSESGTLSGTARRIDLDAELPFHGVIDLVGVIERLVAWDESRDEASDGARP